MPGSRPGIFSLLVGEREAIEGKDLRILVGSGENVLHRGLAVAHLVFLLLQGALLEELLDAALRMFPPSASRDTLMLAASFTLPSVE